MGNVFSLGRFTQLFVNHTVANYRMYLMSLGVLMGVIFLVMVYAASGNDFLISVNAQQAYFSIFLFLGVSIFTTGIFSILGDKRKAIAYLLLPASNLEKLLVAWLYSFLIFHILYIAGFYFVDFIILSMSKKGANETTMMTLGGPGFSYQTMLFAFAWVHSMSFFGAVFFKRLHFIKTALIVFVCALIFTSLNKVLVNLLIGADVTSIEPFGGLMIREGKESYYLEELEMVKVVAPYLTGGVSLLLWIGAYFKLKETEV